MTGTTGVLSTMTPEELVKRLLEDEPDEDDTSFSAANAYNILNEANVKSSSHIEYQLEKNERAWKKVRDRFFERSWEKVVDYFIKAFSLRSRKGVTHAPWPGIETLWKLSGDNRLWPLTDFGNVGQSDQLFVSYVYGNNERLAAFKKYADCSPENMAKSYSNGLTYDTSVVKGSTVTCSKTARAFELLPHEAVLELLQSGWDVDFSDNEDGTCSITFLSFSPKEAGRKAVKMALA